MEPSFASEFPNDNPELGSGADWVCTSPLSHACPVKRPLIYVTPCLIMPEGSVPPPGVVGLRPACAATAVSPEPATESDGFDAFVAALVEISLAAGATRSAALLPALLEEGRVRLEALPEETLETLRVRSILAREGSEVTAAFAAVSRAWREVLRGTSNDLSACGASTLDSWAADLLCALSGAPVSRASDYRRELRRRGIAAFGLLAAA
ncbi:MAG TPA: hypothetical protein VGP93_06710 [Polyangiaceae bacterium]|jgi:hypothetical protein|nr:hypothetical protein [Polyangiaceae bacterium]